MIGLNLFGGVSLFSKFSRTVTLRTMQYDRRV